MTSDSDATPGRHRPIEPALTVEQSDYWPWVLGPTTLLMLFVTPGFLFTGFAWIDESKAGDAPQRMPDEGYPGYLFEDPERSIPSWLGPLFVAIGVTLLVLTLVSWVWLLHRWRSRRAQSLAREPNEHQVSGASTR